MHNDRRAVFGELDAFPPNGRHRCFTTFYRRTLGPAEPPSEGQFRFLIINLFSFSFLYFLFVAALPLSYFLLYCRLISAVLPSELLSLDLLADLMICLDKDHTQFDIIKQFALCIAVNLPPVPYFRLKWPHVHVCCIPLTSQ